MNCKEAMQSLDAYVDGELEAAQQLALEAHCAECVSCKEAAERIAKCSLLIRMNIPVYKTPTHLKSKVRAALRKEDKPNFKWLTDHRPQSYPQLPFFF